MKYTHFLFSMTAESKHVLRLTVEIIFYLCIFELKFSKLGKVKTQKENANIEIKRSYKQTS